MATKFGTKLAVPCLEAASRQIFTALVLVLDFGALTLALVLRVDVLALALVLEVSVLVLVLSQDPDQDTDLQRKVPAFGAVVQACLADFYCLGLGFGL